MNKYISLIIFATFLALTGCATDEPATKPTETVDAQPAEATQEPDPGETVDKEPGIGDTFEFEWANMDGETTPWEVTITEVETVNTLPMADDNPEYFDGDSEQQYADATPQPGNEFVHATYETTNISKRPDSLMLTAQIAFSDGEVFAPLGDDESTYAFNLTNQREDDAGAEQNPGTTHTGDFVIEVPQGSEVTHLVIDAVPGGVGEYWVALS